MNTVNENISVIRLDAGKPVLWRAGEAAPVPLDHVAELPEHLVFAAPSDAVRLLRVAVAVDEVKHLRKALPFRLEEDVAEDIDALHFAFRAQDPPYFLVAVVSRARMADWQELIPETIPWVPESLLLPARPEECCVLVEGDSALVRWPDGTGARIEVTLLPPLMASIDAQALVVYGTDEPAVTEWLPTDLARRVQLRQGGFGAALQLYEADGPAVDLRQGDYAPRLPLARWWEQWQRVAIAAGVALLLQFAADLAQVQRFKSQNLALREAIQESYRRANPRGAVVDVEKQLDRQLEEFGGGGGVPAFTPLLYAVTGAVAAVDGVGLTTLNYTGSGAVRINVNAPDFAAVEALRTALSRASLQATLESSNSGNDGVRARLRIGGGA